MSGLFHLTNVLKVHALQHGQSCLLLKAEHSVTCIHTVLVCSSPDGRSGCLQVSSSVQTLSRVRLFVTLWTAARQASRSIPISWSPLKPMCIATAMPSSHVTLCRPLLLLPSIFASIRVFSNESALRIRWPKYWSFSFSISPSSEHPGLTSFRMDGLISLQSKGPAILFPTVAAPPDAPTGSAQGLQSFHDLVNADYFLSSC